MTYPRKLRLLDVDRLAEECADQTARFFSRVTHDTGFCYELFRRAIIGLNDYAWEKVYQIYQPLVAGWVRRHGGLAAANEDVDYFVNGAFDKMWSAVHAGDFDRFQDVAELLGYLRTCVNSVIVDHNRNSQFRTIGMEVVGHIPQPDVPQVEKYVTDQLERDRLWQTVISLAKNEKETIVLRGAFLLGLKPAEIEAAHPNKFESLDEVYRVKRNLLNRLRRSPRLQQFGDSLLE